MGFSNLISETVMADGSNYSQGRSGYRICKFTPHHMAGRLTGAQCARLFQNSHRNASANYCIGYDGDIVGCVDEDNRAWTSCSKSNDCQAITVEVSNSEIGGDWPISDASWNSLVNLAVDVCRRHNFRLVYDGTPNGSLTRHNMFSNTSCPGPYLQSRFEELAETVNKILDGGQPEPQPTPTPSFRVLYNGCSGQDVSYLQRRLIEKGYSLPKYGADGNFGNETEVAVRELQADANILVDGMVGPQTWSIIESSFVKPTKPAYPGYPIGYGNSGENVKTIQQRLIQLGYSCGSYGADGVFGSSTQNAVKSFQRDRGLVVDGIVGPETWRALF